MAKELPYFKFEPSEWENGNIQVCSWESKGLFMDLCSMYWARLGDLPLKLVMQKLCKGNAHALDELMQEDIISINDGGIITIGFLDEQLKDFDKVKEKRRKAANTRWKNASALQVDMQNDAIKKRREEKREEERRGEEKEKAKNKFSPPSPTDVENYFLEKTDGLFTAGFSKKEAATFFDHFTSNGWKVSGKAPMKDWQASANNWIRRINEFKNGTNNGFTQKQAGVKHAPTKTQYAKP